MIKIYDELWFIVKPGKEDNLAYMTYFAEDKAFEKRKNTGINWASDNLVWDETKQKNVNVGAREKDAVVCGNTPQKRMYIGSSVERWATSNKLFRVTDPRGFTVEVPTGNISTLLHLTTVKNGYVEEPCVWGRDGSNHILLPVNSEPYLEAKKNMSCIENSTKIKISDIKYGTKLKFLGEDRVYTFLGRGKVTYKIKPYRYEGDCRWGYSTREKVYKPEYEYTHKRYTNIFSYSLGSETRFDNKDTVHISEIISEGDDMLPDIIPQIHLPMSVDIIDFWQESEVISVKWKQPKRNQL